jgi:mycothiol synthase
MQQLLMRRSNLDTLPELPALPPGYVLRIACEDDLTELARLLAAAFPDEAWTVEKAYGSLFADKTVKTVFVVEHAGTLTATASARLLPDAYPDSGYVHWVGSDPAHRGLKLGFIVTLATLHEFVALGCQDSVLETDDSRIPAIKTYLKLDFAPVYRDETHRERWEKIDAQVKVAQRFGFINER